MVTFPIYPHSTIIQGRVLASQWWDLIHGSHLTFKLHANVRAIPPSEQHKQAEV